MKIRITNNWMQGTDDVVGQTEFADTAKANFLYEMLNMRPDSFDFGISYTVDDNGKYTLLGVTLIHKYQKYHPIIVKRRLADYVRRMYRRLK